MKKAGVYMMLLEKNYDGTGAFKAICGWSLRGFCWKWMKKGSR